MHITKLNGACKMTTLATAKANNVFFWFWNSHS